MTVSSRPVLVLKRTHFRMQLEKVSVNFSQVRLGANPQDLWLWLFAADAHGLRCSPGSAQGSWLHAGPAWSLIKHGDPKTDTQGE